MNNTKNKLKFSSCPKQTRGVQVLSIEGIMSEEYANGVGLSIYSVVGIS